MFEDDDHQTKSMELPKLPNILLDRLKCCTLDRKQARAILSLSNTVYVPPYFDGKLSLVDSG